MSSCKRFKYFRFSELLALAEDFEEIRSTRVLRQVPSRRASQAIKSGTLAPPTGPSSSMTTAGGEKKLKKLAHDDSDSDSYSDVSSSLSDTRHEKTDLKFFVVVIPKEGWAHVAAPILLLV